MRTENDRAGTPRRLVGEMLAPRAGGLHGCGGTAVKQWLMGTVGMAVAGVAAGAVWTWLAPAIHGVVVVTKSGKRVHEFLGNEADHYFDSAVMMSGLLIGLGVISAVLVWQRRQRRGPAMTIGLTAGGLTAAAAAAGTGAGLARLRYGHIDI